MNKFVDPGLELRKWFHLTPVLFLDFAGKRSFLLLLLLGWCLQTLRRLFIWIRSHDSCSINRITPRSCISFKTMKKVFPFKIYRLHLTISMRTIWLHHLPRKWKTYPSSKSSVPYSAELSILLAFSKAMISLRFCSMHSEKAYHSEHLQGFKKRKV